VTKPIATLVCTVCPGARLTEPDRAVPSGARSSPDSRVNRVVTSLRASTIPVSSSPSGVVAYGEVTRIGSCWAAVPVLVIARLVTATFALVMNFVTSTRIPAAVFVYVCRQ
jgi:hypothetical protein